MSKAHFIGICGAGMSATAKLLHDSGWQISGSDDGFYPPISDYLKKHNLPCSTPYRPENIPADADLIVIGKHAKLVPEENEEVKAAFASGLPVKSFPEVLSDLTAETNNLIFTGSYGKSTCAALAAWCLTQTNRDPSFFIGAIPETPPESSHIGHDQEFVLEGDEYPSSNWSDKSKFLFFHPQHVLLTSLTHDHVNVFPTPESYIKPFSELIKLIPADGSLTACLDGEHISAFIKNIPIPVITYALNSPADWTAKNISYGETTTFSLFHHEQKVADLSTTLLGRHNVENIVGVSALLLSQNLITPSALAAGVRSFKALTRRLDLKSTRTALKIYEGFGSSYTKARAAIDALKLHFPEQRLLVVFEPHTFSWRNRAYLSYYDTAFAGAAHIFIYKPPLHGAATHDQLTLSEIVLQIKKSGANATGFETADLGLRLIMSKWKLEDIILLLTSGDLGGLIKNLPAAAESVFPN